MEFPVSSRPGDRHRIAEAKSHASFRGTRTPAAPTRRIAAVLAVVVLVVGVLAVGVALGGAASSNRSYVPPSVHVHDDGHLHVHAQSDGVPVAPTVGAPFSFGAAGDYSFTGETQTVMTAMGSAGLAFVIALGDTTYGATSEQNWCDYFESKVGDGRALLIAGNHDTGESGGGNINTLRLHCNFGIDATLNGDYGKEYYFDYPKTDPLARFILTGCGVSFNVDGQGKWTCSAGDPHYNFVANAIDEARGAGVPWIFVGMHKNCITNGVKSCEIGEAFQDLLLSKKVDVVLQAHDHNYQRSKQLSCADDNNYRSECVADSDDSHDHGAGEVINVVGTGGQPLYTTGGRPDEPYFVKWNSDTKGFLKVDVSAESLDVAFRNIVGGFTDSYRISRTPSGPDFSISADPTSVSFGVGGSSSTTVTIRPSGGFTGAVDLTSSSNPAGVTASCVPSRIAGGSGTSACTISGGSSGMYVLTIIGTSGALGRAVALQVSIVAGGPTARFTYFPERPEVNEAISFDASSSTNTDPSATLQARWDWEGDGNWDTPYSSTLTALHTFTIAGSHTVKLEILDSNNLADTEVQLVPVRGAGIPDVGAPPGYGLLNPTILQDHAPIYINGNAALTPTNGVRRGAGTVADPYVIRDWLIDGSLHPNTQAMIHIESTDAYVVIENNKIVNLAGTNHWEAIRLGHWPATISTLHVTIRNNHIENARHAYGIAVREGSRDILVQANYVRMDANYEWVHGIETDLGVHDVVIEGNYVDAYTSGTFLTTGIQVSDVHVDEARRATGVIVAHNTIVNATGGGIVSGSSLGTAIVSNLVYSDYPGGTKSVSAGLPVGIDTSRNARGVVIEGNVIQTVVSGILVGSDDGRVVSNTIHDAEWGIFVSDAGPVPGAAPARNSIYNSTIGNVVRGGVRLPSSFEGTVVDLGPGIRPSDLSPVLFLTQVPASRVDLSWSGFLLNLSATVGGSDVFDTAATTESPSVQGSWTGSIAKLDLSVFTPGRVVFHLQSSSDVFFDGSGLEASATFRVLRTNGEGTIQLLDMRSTGTGRLAVTIPAAAPSEYVLVTGGPAGPTNPFSLFLSIPTMLPIMALGLLVVSYIIFHRQSRRSQSEDWEEDDTDPL